MRESRDFCSGFSVAHCDRQIFCVVSLLIFVFLSAMIGYISEVGLPTRVSVPFGTVNPSTNTSHIWFRKTSLVSDTNNTRSAHDRQPTLIIALEKLRLTHEQKHSDLTQTKAGIGEYVDKQWTRQPQIDKLWLKLIDNELEVKHVCHVGIDGGYESVMYLEALNNATVSLFDTCDGEQARVCDTVEEFLHTNYAGRFTLFRGNSPIQLLQEKSINKTCDWLNLNLHGTNDSPQNIVDQIIDTVSCPNIFVMNNVGVDTNDADLVTVAAAWQHGITALRVHEDECSRCYVDASECTYCVGDVFCGANRAAIEAERDEIAQARAGLDDAARLKHSGVKFVDTPLADDTDVIAEELLV